MALACSFKCNRRISININKTLPTHLSRINPNKATMKHMASINSEGLHSLIMVSIINNKVVSINLSTMIRLCLTWTLHSASDLSLPTCIMVKGGQMPMVGNGGTHRQQ